MVGTGVFEGMYSGALTQSVSAVCTSADSAYNIVIDAKTSINRSGKQRECLIRAVAKNNNWPLKAKRTVPAGIRT